MASQQKTKLVFFFSILSFLFSLSACKTESFIVSQQHVVNKKTNIDGTSPTDAASMETINAAGFCGGSGSAQDPFLICNAEQLVKIDGEKVLANGGWDSSMRGLSFRLKKDIDLAGWKPKAQAGVHFGFIRYFAGDLDGSNFKIRNWGANQAVEGGLIILNTGRIHHLIFENFDISAGFAIGAFVGLNYFNGRIEHVTIRNGDIRMPSGSFQSAGVVAGMNSQGHISNILVENVSMSLLAGIPHTGGGAGILVGFNEAATIQNCEVRTSTITVSDPTTGWIVGGAVGINQKDGLIDSVLANTSIVSAGSFDNFVGTNLGQIKP